MGFMPVIHLGLDAITLGQQGHVAGGQVGHQRVKAAPEMSAAHAGAGQDLLFDELMQGGGNLKAMDVCASGHGNTKWSVEQSELEDAV
jgi:hypothetical protein